MSPSCIHHSDRPAAPGPRGSRYCERCRSAQSVAAEAVSRAALPRACLVARAGPERWVPLRADLAVHWVAHTCDLRPTGPATCRDGFAIRGEDLLRVLTPVESGPPQVGDVFQALDRGAWGRVIEFKLDAENEPRISIQYLDGVSGRSAVGDFYRDFRGMGRFLRRA